MLYGFLALHIDRRNNVLHFTRIGGGSDRTVHLAPRVVEVGGSIPLGKSFDVGMAWGCYDADRMGKTRNPDNKYQYFCKYFNDVAKITDDGTMTARRQTCGGRYLPLRFAHGRLRSGHAPLGRPPCVTSETRAETDPASIDYAVATAATTSRESISG